MPQGQFPIEFAKTTPSGAGGGVRSSLSVDTGQREIAQAVSGLGQAIDERNEKIKLGQDAMRLSVLERDYDELTNTYEQQLEKITDEDEANELIEQYEADVEKLAADDKAEVQNAYTISLNRKIGEQKNVFDKIGQAARAKDAVSQWKFAYGRAVDSGSTEGAKETAALALQTGVIGQAEFDAKMADLPVDIQFAQARKDLVTNPQGVINQLTDTEFTSTLSGEQLDTNAKLISTARNQKKIVGTEANKDLTDMMASRSLTLSEVQSRRPQLDDEDYKAWTKIALNPDDKVGNVIQQSEFESASADIWRGSVSQETFDKRVRASLADPNGINNEQYASIVKVAGTTLKSTQAEDIRRYSRQASNVILGQHSGLLQFDAAGNLTGVNMAGLSGDDTEDVKFRMHFLSLYEQGLRNFIAENPKASGKEFYQFAAEQKIRYWNTTLDQMKVIAKQQGKGGEGVSATPTATELRKLNTEEAYEQGKQLGYWK